MKNNISLDISYRVISKVVKYRLKLKNKIIAIPTISDLEVIVQKNRNNWKVKQK